MFLNREEAGIRLALKLSQLGKLDKPIVISIPRGGVIVGKTVSEILKFPHRLILVKKIGAPHNPELAIGATGSDSIVFWDEDLIESLSISKKEQEEALSSTVKTVSDREKSLHLAPLKVNGKTVILVDDGVATGATVIVASKILKKLGLNKIILATPVISKRTKKELEKYFDRIVAVETPVTFQAVGEFYQEFPQVEDEEVKEILNS